MFFYFCLIILRSFIHTKTLKKNNNIFLSKMCMQFLVGKTNSCYVKYCGYNTKCLNELSAFILARRNNYVKKRNPSRLPSNSLAVLIHVQSALIINVGSK